MKKEKIPTVVISNGNKIINQYPKSGTLSSKEKLFLVTDGDNITMPNMKGWSKKDVMTYANLTGLSVVYKGNGYVEKQSIKKGSTINKKSTLTIHLKEKGYLDGKGGRGELITNICIMVPKTMTEQEKALFQELKEISSYDPRTIYNKL